MKRTRLRKSPSALSRDLMAQRGCYVDTCERQIGPHKKDLHGIADLHAFSEYGTWLIQACTATNLARRRTKLLSPELRPTLVAWLRWPGRHVEIHAWRPGSRGEADLVRIECARFSADGQVDFYRGAGPAPSGAAIRRAVGHAFGSVIVPTPFD